MKREEIDFVRIIVCVLNIVGRPLKRIHTYLCVYVRWMPFFVRSWRRSGSSNDRWVGVTAITLAPMFHWAAPSLFFSHINLISHIWYLFLLLLWQTRTRRIQIDPKQSFPSPVAIAVAVAASSSSSLSSSCCWSF